MNQNSHRIGEFFRHARIHAGLDVEQVVEEIGLESVSVLNQYEQGIKAIPLEDIFAMTNLYNVAPDEIVGLFYELSIEKSAAKAKTGG